MSLNFCVAMDTLINEDARSSAVHFCILISTFERVLDSCSPAVSVIGNVAISMLQLPAISLVLFMIVCIPLN